MKLCKDCKWYDGNMWCNSPSNGTCKVTGDIIFRNTYTHRLNPQGCCGEEGNFFEAEEIPRSLFCRIINWIKGE